MKIPTYLTLLLGFCFLPISHGEEESDNVIGATCMTTKNPFFITIQKAMEEEAAKHGYKIRYLSGDDNVEAQHKQVLDFVSDGVMAIAVNPVDSKAIGPAIQRANEAGIPVFTFDMKVIDPDAQIVAHVGTNNFQGGRLAGEAMVEALGEAGGKVVVLDLKAAESCIQRVAGFKEYLGEHNAANPDGKIEIVAELPSNGSTEQGFKSAEDALQAHSDLAGIFAINDPSGLGAVQALEKAGKQDQVKIIAFDGALAGKQAIRDGKIYADPIQFPAKIGQETVQLIEAYFRGKEIAKETLIPSALYRQADAATDPELAE